MLKNISQLEHKIGDKVYHLFCDQDSPLDHVKEALFQFLKFVGQVEDQVKSQQAQSPAQPAASVPPVVEPAVAANVEPKLELV